MTNRNLTPESIRKEIEEINQNQDKFDEALLELGMVILQGIRDKDMSQVQDFMKLESILDGVHLGTCIMYVLMGVATMGYISVGIDDVVLTEQGKKKLAELEAKYQEK